MKRFRFFGTLRRRVFGLAVVASLPPYVVLLSVATHWRGHEVADARASALELVRRAAVLHERELQECAWMLSVLESAAAQLPDRAGHVVGLLSAALRTKPPHENIGIFTADGQLLASARPWPDTGLPRGRSFARAVKSSAVAVDDYRIDVARGTAAVAVAHPIVGSSGRPERVILRVFDVGWLRDFAGDARVPDGTLITLFDGTGEVIAQHPPQPGRPMEAAYREWLLRAAARAEPTGTTEVTSFGGVQRTVAYAPLVDVDPSRRLFVSIAFPTAAATSQTDAILRRDFVAVSIAVLGIMLLASSAGHWWVVHHVEALGQAARRLGDGDMTARVGSEGRPAELGALARTFDAMADALQARERELVRQRDRCAALEHRFRSMLENGSDGIALFDASGRMLYVSPSTQRMLGHAPHELLGRNGLDFVHPEDQESMRAVLAQVLSKPGAPVSSVFRLRHASDDWRWLATDITNLLDDPAVAGIVSNFHDVTEYRASQEALRVARDDLEQRVRQRTFELVKANDALRSEIAERKRTQETLQKLSQVIEQTADSVFVTDRHGVIEYVNPAFEVLTGYSRTEAIGRTPRLIASGTHDEAFFKNLWNTILSGRVFRTIVKNRTKDGSLFDEDQTITPIKDDRGEITHFVSTGRDITERQRRERAVQQLNRMLEQETTRIGNLLHDEAGQFLTSAHILLSEVARDLRPPARERIEHVRHHLNQVEEQLRTISHDLHPRILSDLGLVAAIRRRAEAFARRTGVRVTVEAAQDYTLVPVAQVAVYRLVQEALTNVGRHARANSVAITLSDDGEWFCCSIADDGVGFDLDDLAERPREPSLGLLGMRHRIEAAGGTLILASAPGKGTQVNARLPLDYGGTGESSHRG